MFQDSYVRYEHSMYISRIHVWVCYICEHVQLDNMEVKTNMKLAFKFQILFKYIHIYISLTFINKAQTYFSLVCSITSYFDKIPYDWHIMMAD